MPTKSRPKPPGKRAVLLTKAVAIAMAAAMAPAAAWAQHAAHSHGVVRGNVAVQGGVLALELELPQETVVGFEHRPKTPAQRQAAAAAVALLKDPSLWMQPSAAARCTLVGVAVEAPLLMPLEAAAVPLPSSAPGAKQDELAKQTKPADNAAHADVQVQLRLNCAAPAQLQALELLLMQHFARIQRIELSLALEQGQRSQKLQRQRQSAKGAGLQASEKEVSLKR